MKKGVSPLTTVLVILLVLAIAALAYFYFSAPRQEARTGQAGGGIAPIPGPITGEIKPASPEAKQKAEEAQKKLQEEQHSGKGP